MAATLHRNEAKIFFCEGMSIFNINANYEGVLVVYSMILTVISKKNNMTNMTSMTSFYTVKFQETCCQIWNQNSTNHIVTTMGS